MKKNLKTVLADFRAYNKEVVAGAVAVNLLLWLFLGKDGFWWSLLALFVWVAFGVFSYLRVLKEYDPKQKEEFEKESSLRCHLFWSLGSYKVLEWLVFVVLGAVTWFLIFKLPFILNLIFFIPVLAVWFLVLTVFRSLDVTAYYDKTRVLSGFKASCAFINQVREQLGVTAFEVPLKAWNWVVFWALVLSLFFQLPVLLFATLFYLSVQTLLQLANYKQELLAKEGEYEVSPVELDLNGVDSSWKSYACRTCRNACSASFWANFVCGFVQAVFFTVFGLVNLVVSFFTKCFDLFLSFNNTKKFCCSCKSKAKELSQNQESTEESVSEEFRIAARLFMQWPKK